MSAPVHGGGLDQAIARFGGERSQWLDLSTGINPRAYPVGRIDKAAFERLPDEGALADLIDVARGFLGVPDHLDMVAGAGAQSLIQWLPMLREAACRVAVDMPTYAEHEWRWRLAGHQVSDLFSLEDITHADVVVVTRPNNPDGGLLFPDLLQELASALGARDGLLVVDEAFADVDPDLGMIGRLPDNAVILRSFGKFFGLAGVRLGFAIGHASLIGRLRTLIGPWAVSGPALAIGARAMADEEWIADTRGWIERRTDAMWECLHNSGLNPSSHAGLFVLAEHERAHDVADGLARRHILVRRFDDEPTWLRFGLARSAASIRRLRISLDESVAEAGDG